MSSVHKIKLDEQDMFLLRLSDEKSLDEIFSFLCGVSKISGFQNDVRCFDLSSNFLVDVVIRFRVLHSKWQLPA